MGDRLPSAETYEVKENMDIHLLENEDVPELMETEVCGVVCVCVCVCVFACL